MNRLKAKAISRFKLKINGREVVDFSGSAAITGYFFGNENIGGVSSNIFETDESFELRKKLSIITQKKNVFLTSSATEACDIALASEKKSAIISFEGAYHGLTYLTRKVSFEKGIDLENKIVHLPFPIKDSTDEIETISSVIEKSSKLLNLDQGALIFEPIQVHAGVRPIRKNLVSFIKELKSRYNLTLIADEAYTGYGRTGYFVYSRELGIEPDVIVFGKGIAGEIPLGAICTNRDDLSETGVLGTLSGNAKASSIALKLLDLIDEQMLNRVLTLSEKVKKLFSPLPNYFKEIRGSGFVLGIEFDERSIKNGFNQIFREELIRQGVVCNLVGEGKVLKITPPVLIDDDDFEFGTRAIEKTILKFNK